MFSDNANDGADYDFDFKLDEKTVAVPGTAAGSYSFGAKKSTKAPDQAGGASRMGTQGGAGGEARPLTSMAGAGFSSKQGNNRSFDPLNQNRGAGEQDTRMHIHYQTNNSIRLAAASLAEKADNSAEDLAKVMEKAVHKLIEESAIHSSKHEFTKALEKAKDAGKKERALTKHRDSNGLVDQINIDLTYAVWFNLANVYQQNGMNEEALNTYTIVVKNKQYPQSGRLRVNMGNIYYSQKKFPQAIKMYRMALDQIPNSGKEVRFKIFRNIGNAFVRLGQFQDAIQSFETIMNSMPDFQSGFNLILCYFALGDAEKMKRGFTKVSVIFAEDENKHTQLTLQLLYSCWPSRYRAPTTTKTKRTSRKLPKKRKRSARPASTRSENR